MTNEEAIHAIRLNYPPENYSRLREALDMAMVLLAAESKPMINWIKYDPENPPKDGRYLISNETDAEMGIIYTGQWYSDGDMGMGHSEVTHYANINLPGEEKEELQIKHRNQIEVSTTLEYGGRLPKRERIGEEDRP